MKRSVNYEYPTNTVLTSQTPPSLRLASLVSVHSVNWGNRAFTTRLEANGFDFFHLLPAGRHEPSTVAVEQEARLKRASERKAEAKKFIEEERRKQLM